jgi:uncharacterized membrane protein
MSEPARPMHKVFVVSLTLKAANALLEIIAGILFLFTGTITTILRFLVQNELVENRSDALATFFRHSVLPHLSSHSQLFTATYLLIHGVVKVFIVIGLFSRRLWAYQIAEIVLFLFIAYQLYEYALTRSLWLVGLSIFDTLLLWLTWHEHQAMKIRYNKNVL